MEFSPPPFNLEQNALIQDTRKEEKTVAKNEESKGRRQSGLF